MNFLSDKIYETNKTSKLTEQRKFQVDCQKRMLAEVTPNTKRLLNCTISDFEKENRIFDNPILERKISTFRRGSACAVNPSIGHPPGYSGGGGAFFHIVRPGGRALVNPRGI